MKNIVDEFICFIGQILEETGLFFQDASESRERVSRFCGAILILCAFMIISICFSII